MQKKPAESMSDTEKEKLSKLENRLSALEKKVGGGDEPRKKIIPVKKVMLNVTEAAQFLGLEVSGVRMLTHKKLIPYYKPNGKTMYFDPKELAEWQKRNRQAPVYEKGEKDDQQPDQNVPEGMSIIFPSE